MGLSRKKARTKPPKVDESPPKLEQQTSTPSNDVSDSKEATPTPSKDPKGTITKQLRSKGSWYGTWPRKSTASTQVARETILADKPTNGSSSDLSRYETKSVAVSSSAEDGKRNTETAVDGAAEDKIASGQDPTSKDKMPAATEVKAESIKDTELPKPSDNPPSEPSQTEYPRPATASGWLGGWFGRPNPQAEVSNVVAPPETMRKDSEQLPAVQETTQSSQPSNNGPANNQPNPPTATSTSWFGRWSTARPSTATEAPNEQIPVKAPEGSEDTVMKEAPAAKGSDEPAAGSSWAFWSVDTSKKTAPPTAESKETGQLAVAGSPSQDHPEPAKSVSIKDDKVKDKKKGKSSKRGRPLSTEVDETPQDNAPIARSVSQSPAPSKPSPPNILLPSVRSTYGLVENPSIIQQIARLLHISHQPPTKHVFLAKEQPRLKKALAIGIHGLFPAALLRTVIGQPTGTSIRFANQAAAAIRRWTDAKGFPDCEIEKVALEGEGKIAERVDNLWKLLLNWMDHVRSADFIMVACHSQGVPVAMMLVAKLIEFDVVTNARIGVCAMAGVSLGPFADYKSRLFSGSAGELFEFANPDSAVSTKYTNALQIALKYGVRVTYCGSIDDQVVSMESAIFSTASHPYIYRAVFVDGRIHAPDFIAHLVGFALKLRNLGVSDHGLIRELSAPLAGSLYTGEGHSRLYDDEVIYDLAIEFALETTSIGEIPLDIKKYEVPTNSNPYVLPWIMRGLLEEDFVKTELDTETTELLKQFDEWKPATKVLKDVKYRLEAVRLKL